MATTARFDRRSVMRMLGASILASTAFGSARAAVPDRLHMLVGMPGGTNSDSVARALAQALQAIDGGKPIDIENMGGSSGRVAFKTLAAAAGNAGTVGIMQNGLLYALLTDEGDGLDKFRGLSLLGALGREQRALYVATATGIRSVEELVAHADPLITPTINITSSNAVETQIINATLGAHLKIVPGFSGAERRLALISGEGQVLVGGMVAMQDLEEQGTVVPILRLNPAAPGDLHPELPRLIDLAKTDEHRLTALLIETAAEASQLVMAPSGVGAADLDSLAALFDEAAARLPAMPRIGYTDDDIVWSKRDVAQGRLDRVFGAPGMGDILRRTVACGAQLGDGGSC